MPIDKREDTSLKKLFTNKEHAAWLREQARLKRPYWYGVYHLPCTEALLKKKASQYPAHYESGRMARYRADIAAGQIAGDCVNGAIKGAVWSELGRRVPVYASNGCPDTNADGIFAKCKAWGMDWGPIETIPDLPGVAVRFAGHVGVYVGEGEVVEWRGFAHGCVVTKLKERKWTHWYKLPWTEYTAGDAADGAACIGTLGARLIRRGCVGEDVRTLQELLMKLGIGLPAYGADGEFGGETEAAVRSFQRKRCLKPDGIYGEMTHEALMSMLDELEEEQEGVQTETETPRKVRVTGRYVRLRSGAGQEFDTIGFVRGGMMLEWIATAENGWHAVRTDGMSGWIGPRFTRIEETA